MTEVDIEAERQASMQRRDNELLERRARWILGIVGGRGTWQEYREAAANEWPGDSPLHHKAIATAAERMEPEERHLDPVTTPVRPLEPPEEEEDLVTRKGGRKRFDSDVKRSISRLVRQLLTDDPKMTTKAIHQQVVDQLGIEISEGYLGERWIRPSKRELKREAQEEKEPPAPAPAPAPAPEPKTTPQPPSSLDIDMYWPGRGRLRLSEGRLEADGKLADALAAIALEGLLDELKPPRAEADDED